MSEITRHDESVNYVKVINLPKCLVVISKCRPADYLIVTIDCITQMFDQHISQNKIEGRGTFHA